MKTTLALFLLLALTAVAGPTNATTSCSIGWMAPLAPTVATNYVVWCGTISGYYTIKLNAGTNLTATVSNLTRGTKYFFSVSCTHTNGVNSGCSSEISWTPPLPNAPYNVMTKD